jgi:hypothetical protein
MGLGESGRGRYEAGNGPGLVLHIYIVERIDRGKGRDAKYIWLFTSN